jgi:hypothetical protein
MAKTRKRRGFDTLESSEIEIAPFGRAEDDGEAPEEVADAEEEFDSCRGAYTDGIVKTMLSRSGRQDITSVGSRGSNKTSRYRKTSC